MLGQDEDEREFYLVQAAKEEKEAAKAKALEAEKEANEKRAAEIAAANAPEPEVVEEPPSLLTRLLPPQRRRCVAILGGSLVGALGARAVWDSVFRTRADPTDKSRSSTGIKQHDR